MNQNLLPYFLVAVLALFPATIATADEPATTESRLRDALRNTMLQLRDAQGQVATFQAAQDQSDKDKAALQAKVDGLNGQIKSLTEQAASDKTASDKMIADLKQNEQDLVTEMVDTLTIQINLLNKSGTDDKTTLDKSIADMKSKNADTSKAIGQYGTDIQLWKTGYYQYVQFATQTDAARAKLAAEAILLRRVVDDRERKNLQLFNTGSEILTRYEKFSLGDALTAKEPFVGVTRVKLQELVQDYKDKLLTQKITIGQPISTAPAPGASPKNSAPAKPGIASNQPAAKP